MQDTTTQNPTQKPTPAPEAPLAQPKAPTPKGKNQKIWFIIGAVLLVALAVTTVILLTRKTETPTSNVPAGVAPATPEEAAKPSYTLDRNENGERELFGSDESKNNSGEAFVEYQNAIASSSDSSQAEVFDAKIMQAVYYTALGLYDDAQAALDSLDQSTFNTEQQERFTNVSSRLNSARGN